MNVKLKDLAPFSDDEWIDEDESLEVFDASFEDCLDMIQNGQITDGKTIIALFMAEKYLAIHPQF